MPPSRPHPPCPPQLPGGLSQGQHPPAPDMTGEAGMASPHTPALPHRYVPLELPLCPPAPRSPARGEAQGMGCRATGCSQPHFWDPSPSPATLYEFPQLRGDRSSSAVRAGPWGATSSCIHYPEGHQWYHPAHRAPQGWPLARRAGGYLTWGFGEGGWDAQAVLPEVRAAVGDGAVAEEVAVAEGVMVGHSAAVITAVAADVPLLAVGPTGIVDPVLVQAGGQLPADAYPGSQGRLGQQPEAEQGPQQAHVTGNVPRPAAAAEGGK